MRQASASPWFPCPKCGYPINEVKDYLGKEDNPLDENEAYAYYGCPECGQVIKKVEIRYKK